MNTKKIGILVCLLIVPTCIFYFFVYTGTHHVSRLPFYGPKQLKTVKSKGRLVKDSLHYAIKDFKVVTYQKDLLTASQLDGKIYLAHFLDYNLLDTIPKSVVYMVKEVLSVHQNLQIVTFFENFDSTSRLDAPEAYTKALKGADSAWHYVVAPQKTINYLHYTSFFPDLKNKKDPYSVVLVDKERHIRGYYNMTHAKGIKQLKKEIAYLKKEYFLNYKTHRYYKYDDEPIQKR